MKRLIVNADDFGWSEAVTGGILQAHREGVLTSTTLMTNLPGAEAALDRARREAPRLAIGIHLNLVEGRPLAPLADVAPLLGSDGCFTRSLITIYRRTRLSAAARRAARCEFAAQVRWALDRGLAPSHLDSHKHVHLVPGLFEMALDVAREYGVPAVRTTAEVRCPDLARLLPRGWGTHARLRQRTLESVARVWGARAQRLCRNAGVATTDWFFGVRATGGISAEIIENLLRHAPEGTGELMMHPGLPAPTADRLAESRPRELAALCNGRVRRAADELGWTWASFKDLHA